MVVYLSIVILIITLTRFLAYWGIYFLKNEGITLIDKVLYLTYVENTGAAFGIFKNETVMLSILGVLIFLAITFIIASKKNSEKIIYSPSGTPCRRRNFKCCRQNNIWICY